MRLGGWRKVAERKKLDILLCLASITVTHVLHSGDRKYTRITNGKDSKHARESPITTQKSTMT